jgi:putative serine protease PepD
VDRGFPAGFVLAFSLAFALTLGLPARALAMDNPELAERAKPSVLLLNILDESGRKIASGTGFIVSTDGRVITNNHVIQDAGGVVAKTADGHDLEVAGLLATDPAKDIAVVQLRGSGYVPLELGDSRTVRVGEDVIVIGSPLGLSQVFSAGLVSAVREKGVVEEEGDRVDSWGIQITAPVSHGSSGSPVMTRDGAVIGVAVGLLAEGQNLNFAVPIDIAKGMLAKLPPGTKPRPFSTSTPARTDLRNALISLAFFSTPFLAYFVWKRRAAGRSERRPRRYDA